ncbi:MAG: alpha/beta fold hydrolase [Deltaproteobacteria bacterium]|nr:alpha/beta fold hydrolase [Deltaproteobacteria bacterium]
MTHFVLVHGCPGDARAWEPLAPHLSSLDALDLPDHGAEEVPSATVDDHVAHVVAAISRASGPVVLVGHSYGAWVAGHAAARAPDRVAKLVLLSGLADIVGDTAAGLVGFAEALEAGVLTPETGTAIAAQRWLGSTPHAPDQVERIRQLLVTTGSTRLARQLRRVVKAVSRVPRTTVPTRVVSIADDVAVPRALSEDLANVLGVPLEVWPGSNHFAHWVDPALVARELAR